MLPALPEISHCGGRSSSAQRASWQEGSGSRREHDDANNSKPLSTRSRPGRAIRRPTWCWRGLAHASVATRQCRCSTDRPRAAAARCRRACVEAAFGRTQHFAVIRSRARRINRGAPGPNDCAALKRLSTWQPLHSSYHDSAHQPTHLESGPGRLVEWPPGNRKNDRAVALSLSR